MKVAIDLAEHVPPALTELKLSKKIRQSILAMDKKTIYLTSILPVSPTQIP